MAAGTRRLADLGAGRLERVGGLAHPGGHVGGDALAHQLGDDADAQAGDALGRARPRTTAAGSGIEVESSGSWPAMTSSSSGGVGHRGGERADLVERRGEGDQAVARHQAVGGLHARPRRTARRAGGSSRRCRSRAPAGRSRRPPPPRCRPTSRPARGRGRGGCGWGRRPSSRSSCPWRTRRGWSCRSTMAPAAGQPLDDGGVVGRAPALEDPRRAGGGDAPGAEVVLERDRHAGQRARRRSPAATRRSSASAAAAGLVGQHQVEGVERRARPRRCGPGGRRRPRAPSGRPRAPRRRSSTAVPAGGAGDVGGRAAHGSSPRMARHPEAAVDSAGGAWASTSSRSRVGPDDVVAQHVGQRVGVGRRRDAGQVERLDVGGVVEHRRQLAGELVELVVGQRRGGPGGPRGPRRRG